MSLELDLVILCFKEVNYKSEVYDIYDKYNRDLIPVSKFSMGFHEFR